MKSFLLAVALAVVAPLAHGQIMNPLQDTVQWEYEGMMDLRNLDSIPRTGRIITYATEQLVWIQDGFDTQYTIAISSTNGSWIDLSSNGQVTCNVVCNGIAGTATMFRDGSGLHFRLELVDGDKLTPRLSFNIKSASKYK